MALPRKKPAKIFKRDHAFTQTIGKPAADKPNPFALAAEGLKETIEASFSAESSSPAPPEPAPEPRQPDDVSASPELPAAMVAAPEAPDPQPAETTGAVPEPPATDNAEAEEVEDDAASKAATEGHAASRSADAPREAERAGDSAAPVELAITMWIHSDLVERAEKWGAAMRLPAGTILRQVFAKLKPELVVELRTITTGDVHLDRAERVGHRLQSRLRFSPAEFADMKARLDPADFGILTSMLNHYARNRFASFLDELMAGAGY